MSRVSRSALIVLWWFLLAAAALVISRNVHISGDLRSFMPPAQTDDQKLLMDEIGNGPASQLLLIAIGGAPEAKLGALSSALAQKLRDDPNFSRIINGESADLQLDSDLLPYRYLLSPTLDTQTFDTTFLHDELSQRVQDVASPAADMLNDLLPRDPTLEVLKLAQRWAPAKAPLVREGVWFSPRGEALMLAQTKGAAFDPGAQTAAIDSLQTKFSALPDVGDAKLTITGPGYFGAKLAATTRAEAERLSAIGTIGFLILLLVAYRSFAVIALVGLPLASGALAGLASIALAFGEVHGITLAFGFTLLGVAQEYPIRVFSHRRNDATTQESVAAVWPLLRLAVVSACIAYVAFFASGVPGLQQLAVFTIVGLLVAGMATRWALPPLLPTKFHDAATLPFIERVRVVLSAMPKPRWLPWLLLVVAVLAMWLAPTPLWQNDLSALTPISAAELQREGELRDALGAPDIRYLLVLEADSADGVLALSERISPQVEKLISSHAVDDVELPSRYLPSTATQRARQAKLPDRATLSKNLDDALRDLPFQPDAFAPFLDDVEKARALSPLSSEQFGKSTFGARLQAMLTQRGQRWFGLGTFSGVRDASALQQLADTTGNVHILDLKGASESLVMQYRTRILNALGIALILLAVAVAVALRDPRRAWHVIAPMSLATLLVLAVLRVSGVSLSLFHLVAVTLAAGLGLHYALFFERPVDTLAEMRRTLHGTLVCVISAVLVFGLLATSSLPVLRAIGLTVALGVAFHFCLSIQMAQRRDDAR
ncbi:MAG: MMPL family transporter [Rudaea sp.]